MSKKAIGVSKIDRKEKTDVRPLGTPRPKVLKGGRRGGKSQAAQDAAPTAAAPAADPLNQLEQDVPPEEKIAEGEKSVDNVPAADVVLAQTNDAAIQSPSSPSPIIRSSTMTLKLTRHNKKGNRATYSGAVKPIAFNVAIFGGTAPETIEDFSAFLPAKVKAVKVAKVKLTKEERAALPKPTLAEKIAKREAALARDKAKLAAASAM